MADYRPVGRRIAVIAAGIDDSERKGFVVRDFVFSVIEVVNEHMVFPVQCKGEVNLLGV